MKPSEAYQEYLAINAHLRTRGYDYFKYQGKVKGADYDNAKDKKFFYRLSFTYNTQSLQEYYLANILKGITWVGNMNRENWLEWKKKIVRLNEIFQKDINEIKSQVEKDKSSPLLAFVPFEGEHPLILRMLLGEKITLETFTILTLLIPSMLPKYDETLWGDPIWEIKSKLVKKYSPFLKLKLDPSWNLKSMANGILKNG